MASGTISQPTALGGHSFAERLRQMGEAFELEVRQSAETSVQTAQREARALRDEVEWLQRQLEDERHQSAVRLSLCAELKRQVEDVQDAYTQEGEAREYWEKECAAYEEKHSLLEAKLAGIEMTEAEAKERHAQGLDFLPSASVGHSCIAETAAAAHGRNSPQKERHRSVGDDGTDDAARASVDLGGDIPGASPGESYFPPPDKDNDKVDCPNGEAGDEADRFWESLLNPPPAAVAAAAGGEAGALEQHLRLLEEPTHTAIGSTATAGDLVGAFSTEAPAAFERCLDRLTGEDLHALLMAAVRRTKGAAALVHRVARLWVCQLLNKSSGAALRAAVGVGSTEALRAMLTLGGQSAARMALAPIGAANSTGTSSNSGDRDVDNSTCALRACVERNDPELLTPLLESLRGSGQETLNNVRKAHELAVRWGRSEVVTPLGAHLVVELSLQGNTKYRSGEFDTAILCYSEAIALCEDGCAREGVTAVATPAASSASTFEAPGVGRARENLVRLRYNLARALHRTDRWSEAREQATAVLELDPAYVNAYALRAQAAMSSLDWLAAQSDWDRLMAICSATQAAGAGSRSTAVASDDVIAAWQRRREECTRQLSVGHYEVLELPRLASIETVKRAYRDLARRWHPDKHQHKSRDYQERAARRFNRIREAYEVLSEDSLKRAYDAVLLLREARPLTPGRENGAGFPGSECVADGGRGSAFGSDDPAGPSRDPRQSAYARRASDPGYHNAAGSVHSAASTALPRESPRERGRGSAGGSFGGAGGPLPGTVRRGSGGGNANSRGPLDRSSSEEGLLGMFAAGSLPRDWAAAEASGLHKQPDQWSSRWSAGVRSPTGLAAGSMTKGSMFDSEAHGSREPEGRTRRPL